jgi:YHS domain-containing protein
MAHQVRTWECRKIRNKVHLSFTGCLGSCATGNNAMLQLCGQSIWFKDLNDDSYVPAIFDYIEAMLHANQVLPPPPALVEHVFLRYLPSPTDPHNLVLTPVQEDDGAGLERLDPVCLMDVDPATARWSSEYNGHAYYFCAPSCNRTFDREPAAYVHV